MPCQTSDRRFMPFPDNLANPPVAQRRIQTVKDTYQQCHINLANCQKQISTKHVQWLISHQLGCTTKDSGKLRSSRKQLSMNGKGWELRINTSCFLVHSSKYTQIWHHFPRRTCFLQIIHKECLRKQIIIIWKKKYRKRFSFSCSARCCNKIRKQGQDNMTT